MNPDILKQLLYRILYVSLTHGICVEADGSIDLINRLYANDEVQILKYSIIGRK